MRITPYAAGHVLGAAMFLVEIAGMKLLYTGDYSRMPDRHLAGAEMPDVRMRFCSACGKICLSGLTRRKYWHRMVPARIDIL